MLSKKEIRLIVTVIFLLSVALISFINKSQIVPAENNFVGNFIVSKIIDGDTIELQNGEKVRYIGIDTPETLDPRKPVQCFGKEASLKNKELIEGKEVRLVKDVSERDKYGRLLRYVYVGDVFINEKLVAEGYARAFTYPPDVAYSQLFIEKERLARENKLGLWGGCGGGRM